MENEKRILMILARKDFRDEEYFIPLDIFRRAGAEVTTAGSKAGSTLGVLGGEARMSLDLDLARQEDFDAVVFVGGSGSQEFFKDHAAHHLAQEFAAAGKIVAAICIAPVILANAGVLKGRTATVWQDSLDKTGPEALKAGGCNIGSRRVEVSGNIITANGREAAKEFAETILDKLGI